MAFYTLKKLQGKEYIYLEERGWVEGRVQRTFQKYIGPRDRFPDLPIGQKNAVQLDDVYIQKVFQFGLGAALWSIAKELNLPHIMDTILGDQKAPQFSMGEYLTLAAINRVDDPGSKTYLATWFKNSWLSTRWTIEPRVLNAQTYWNHFQRLSPAFFTKVELELGHIIHTRFELPLEHLFYDTTNIFTYSAIDDDNGLRHFGHSKQNQNGLPLINYYLLCSKPYGIPILHHTYAGNTQDAEAFKTVPSEICPYLSQLGIDLSKMTLSFDKGNLSPQALGDIDKKKRKFIASLRNSTQKDLLHISHNEFTTTTLPASKKIILYWRTQRKIYGVMRTLYVVIDPAKQKKHQQQFQQKLSLKMESLQDFIQTQLNIKKWRDKDAVESKFHSLIGKKPWKDILKFQVEGEYAQLKVNIAVDASAQSAYEETLGRTILFTNQDAWSPEDVIWGYREQYVIEHAFRTMKDPKVIAVRPVLHSNNKCIDAHIFTCVLGLFLLSILRLKLSKRGIHLTYDQIIAQLRELHAVQIQVKTIHETTIKMEKIPLRSVKLVKLLHLDQLISEDKMRSSH